MTVQPGIRGLPGVAPGGPGTVSEVSEHLRMAARPRWVAFTVFALLLLVAFLLLGRWQLDRAASQQTQDLDRAAAAAAAPVDVAELAQPGSPVAAETEWRVVTAKGTYDREHQLLVRNRPLDGANGYLVLVPLRTDTGAELLVVRGWIPSGETAGAPDVLPTVPPGTVEVEGRWRVPEPTSGTADLPAGQIERIVPAEIAQVTGQPTYGGWLQLGSEVPAPATADQLRRLPDDTAGGWRWPISHTVYAVQWFIFAAIAVGGWILLLRRDVQAERLPAASAPVTHDS